MKMLRATLASLTLVSSLGATSAFADDYNTRQRGGFTAGIGAGFGHLACSIDGSDENYCKDFNEAFSVNAHLGAMLAPNFALIADVWWMFHSEGDLTVNQGIITAAARFWPVKPLWLQAGIGVAQAGFKYDGTFIDLEDHTEWVPGFSLGVGIEPISTPDFGMDISLRYGTGLYSDGDYQVHNLSLNVGFNLY